MNPYHVLGVNPSASLEDIKLAWRRLSKIHHPDRKGGSAERQAEINLAYNILTDKAAREQYDLSGDTTEVPPLDVRSKQLLMQFLLAAIKDPQQQDVYRSMKAMIKQNSSNFRQAISAHRRELERLDKLRWKIKFKNGGAESLGGVFANVIDYHSEQIDKMKADVETLTRAKELLDFMIESDKALGKEGSAPQAVWGFLNP